MTVLHHAVFKAPSLVRLLIPNSDLNARDSEQKTVLHHVSYGNAFEVVERLVTSGAAINLTDRKGKSCMQLALLKTDRKVIKFLLSQGFDLNLLPKSQQRQLLPTLRCVSVDQALLAVFCLRKFDESL
jgi:uncharacterized protein